MSDNKQIKAKKNLYQQILQMFSTVSKRLLRSLLVIGRRANRRARLSRSGFVLPTVVMVGLVVVLLTTAILVRSFDRSKNASNVRVNQVVLNAAAPAIDRAKAKIEDVLAKLAGKIPSDLDLNTYFTNTTYTLGDETPLEIAFDIDNNGIIKSQPGSTYVLENDETIKTAWKFPVDTDNNGKFDAYTIYGIYYRSPSRNTTTGNFNQPRNPLDARTAPMSGGTISGQCQSATGTSASLVGSSSWYKTGANLAKSFFAYIATVPITNTSPPSGYETSTGNKGFSALEFQQDRTRIPLSNNAVVYEDDIELNPLPAFRLNGRLVTNSNLLVGNFGYGINFYQVSSPYSCYYQEENSQIVVGGNVAAGGILSGYSENSYQPSTVDLFQGAGNSPTQDKISSTNRSTTNTSPLLSYNTQAYAQRIARLVAAQSGNASSTDPFIVQQQVNAALTSQQAQVRQTQLQTYFTNRTRRVPSFEVPYGGNALMTNGTNYKTVSPLQGSGDTLRPIDAWAYPTSTSDGITGTGYTGLTLKTDQLQATEPQTEKQNGKETYLGDRVQVGNNLPALWFSNGAFAGSNTQQTLSGINWTAGSGTRYRQTRVQALADLGLTDRDGFWEQAAAAKPTTLLDNNGGLRVVTGAGVYERKNSFLPTPYYDNPTTTASEYLTTYDDPATAAVEQYPMVWPDSMPMSPWAGAMFPGAVAKVFNNTATPPQWTILPTWPLTSTNSTPQLPTIDPNTPKYAKGDLRMRATVVYHYAKSTYDPINSPATYQTPIACISSYYDPTNSLTTRNPVGLADVSGILDGSTLSQAAVGVAAKSNNGIVYPPPTSTASSLSGVSGSNATTGLFGSANNGDENSTTLLGRLYYQANLKFPNGRFVNEPLRNALNALASNQKLTLSNQSAIDSTTCALQILDGTLSSSITPTTGVTIKNGAIQEISFLDARQIKAIEQDNTTTNALETFTNDGDANLTGIYNLSIEQRQPLEIRATVLDMDLLRQQTITGTNVLAASEYLLPNTGIIYASRDDALLDLSDNSVKNDGTPDITTRKIVSPTDLELDPTRRPHSILLNNGSNLSRSQTFQPAEKGLILATNLPVYVNGNFNLHTHQEFTNLLTSNWSNFYTRTASQIDPNFACRTGDPSLSACTQGDTWRSASVLADAVTLLSDSFKFGFRNDGDYDLRNNSGNWDSINKRLNNGFWNNSFVTSRNFQDSIYSGNTGNTTNDSSYFNNFITPIQRRVNFPEYVMEICRKLPVSECQVSDWVVTVSGVDKQASSIATGTLASTLQTGTTATPATATADQLYARRVAFLRDNAYLLVADNSGNPIPLGIDSSKKVQQYANGAIPPVSTNGPSLWFRGTTNVTNHSILNTAQQSYAATYPLFYMGIASSDGTIHPPTTNVNGETIVKDNNGKVAYKIGATTTALNGQPLLVPVLQNQNPDGSPTNVSTGSTVTSTRWMIPATTTTFNLIAAAGDSSTRANSNTSIYESNGGLHNFVRFLENWNDSIPANINGSFIQLKRSAYATAPWSSVFSSLSGLGGIFTSPQAYKDAYGGIIPHYVAPVRQWGFDVALLSQSPDLFAQKLTLAPTSAPNEFFREVPRDDSWIQALLCAAQKDTTGNYSSRAVDTNQLPTSCPSLPYP